MRTGTRVLNVGAALVGSAVILQFSLFKSVFASQGDLFFSVTAERGIATDGSGGAAAAAGADTDNSAMCAKCHSACENGRSHRGRAPVRGEGGTTLPLDAEGRTTCTTCHDSHSHDEHAVTGAHLRISNLRRELCLNCHRQEDDAAPQVEIVSPREGALVPEDHLALIGRAVRLSGSDLAVRLNGSEFHLRVEQGGFSTWLRLRDGVNRIEVVQQEHLLWKGEVFRCESSPLNYKLASSGHRTGSRAQCRECHLKRDEVRPGVAGAAPAFCYGCHGRVDQKRYVHGPLAVGDCLACHDPHSGYGTAHLRQEQTQLCRKCHGTSDSAAARACNTKGKGCVDCHDPHQSDSRYLLKGPQYTMR